MLKHKLIELTTCFDRQISEMCLFNKVLHQVGHHNSQVNRLKLFIKVVSQHNSQMHLLKLSIKVVSQHNPQMHILKLFTKVVSHHNSLILSINTSAATADYDQRAERHELATQEEKRQIEQRYEQMAEGIGQEAFAALRHVEQKGYKDKHKTEQ